MLIGANDYCYDICYVNSKKIVDKMEEDFLATLRIVRDNLPRTFFSVIIGPCNVPFPKNHFLLL